MRVRDIMTVGVHTVPPSKSCEEAWDLMRQYRIHHLVVARDAKVAGVISERDCGGRGGAALRRLLAIEDLMTAPAVTVASDTSLQRAANMMRGRSIGCLVVVDDDRVKGIVTVSDLLEFIGRGNGTRRPSQPRPDLHHRIPHRKQRRPH
jgi:CBS domain-containing protein